MRLTHLAPRLYAGKTGEVRSLFLGLAGLFMMMKDHVE